MNYPLYSCYMNSVMQSLLNLDEFRERYAKEGEEHLAKCERYPPDCFRCQLSKVAVGLWSGKHSVKKEAKPEMIEGPDGKLYEKEMEVNSNIILLSLTQPINQIAISRRNSSFHV